MMSPWSRAALAIGGAVGGTTAAVAVRSRLWDRSTARAVGRLIPDGTVSRAEAFSPAQIECLPDPVVRYFQFALTPGQPLVRSARIQHQGEFRLGGMSAPWRPFTSVQHIATHPPGFVWDATIWMAPFLPIRVRDSYVGGGSMQARLASYEFDR